MCRRYGRDLARKREELIGRMGGPDIVEPGPLSLQVVFKDSGLTTADEDGRQVPVINRYLLVYEDDDEFFGEAGDAAA